MLGLRLVAKKALDGYFKGNELMEYCSQWLKSLTFLTILALVISWLMYVWGWHFTHKAIATFSSFSAGFCLFLCLMVIIKPSRNSRILTYFANISYEVYLVHLPLLPFVSYMLLVGDESSRWLIVVLWLVLTFIFATCIHKTVQKMILYSHK